VQKIRVFDLPGRSLPVLRIFTGGSKHLKAAAIAQSPPPV